MFTAPGEKRKYGGGKGENIQYKTGKITERLAAEQVNGWSMVNAGGLSSGG